MRRVLSTVGVLASAVVLLLAVTAASLIGLNAECNGTASECPRSDAYRFSLISVPMAVAAVLLAGGALCVRKRALWPLVLAEATAIAVWAVSGAFDQSPNLGTVFWLGLAILLARLALGRRQASP